jgi:hypothetical protein
MSYSGASGSQQSPYPFGDEVQTDGTGLPLFFDAMSAYSSYPSRDEVRADEVMRSEALEVLDAMSAYEESECEECEGGEFAYVDLEFTYGDTVSVRNSNRDSWNGRRGVVLGSQCDDGQYYYFIRVVDEEDPNFTLLWEVWCIRCEHVVLYAAACGLTAIREDECTCPDCERNARSNTLSISQDLGLDIGDEVAPMDEADDSTGNAMMPHFDDPQQQKLFELQLVLCKNTGNAVHCPNMRRRSASLK